MRKIATSLAVIAALFVSQTTADKPYMGLEAHHAARAEIAARGAGRDIRDNINAGAVFPRANVLKSAPFKNNDGACDSIPDSEDTITGNSPVGGNIGGVLAGGENCCSLHHAPQGHRIGCQHHDCFVDDWGIKNHVNHNLDNVDFTGTQTSLGATVVPIMVEIENTTSTTAGNCHTDSTANRTANEGDCYQVFGEFKETSYDCQHDCLRHSNCFHTNGTKTHDAFEDDQDHEFSPCHCHAISPSDLTDIQSGCTCGSFPKKISNPEEEIRKKINKQIYKTIGQTLSEIL
jgi:hypothetical protein